MAVLTALYDSCVLYSAPITDLLMQLAVEELFRARWTERIHDEWMRHLLHNRPDLTLGQLRRRRELMDSHVRDCLVEGYESHIEGLTLPDPDDRHVLAAAIRCRAHVIVTFDRKHFPEEALRPFGIEALHPDGFLEQLLGMHSGRFCAAVRRQRSTLRRPPRSAQELLETLARNGLPRTAERLREFVEIL